LDLSCQEFNDEKIKERRGYVMSHLFGHLWFCLSVSLFISFFVYRFNCCIFYFYDQGWLALKDNLSRSQPNVYSIGVYCAMLSVICGKKLRKFCVGAKTMAITPHDKWIFLLIFFFPNFHTSSSSFFLKFVILFLSPSLSFLNSSLIFVRGESERWHL